MPIHYLPVEDIIELHDKILARQGQQPQPLRDRFALESALDRVKQHAHYQNATIHEQAAILAISIAQAQAFVDGNKRTAYMALVTFYRRNGHEFTGHTELLAKFIELQAFLSIVPDHGDAPSTLGRETLTIWLQTTTHPTPR